MKKDEQILVHWIIILGAGAALLWAVMCSGCGGSNGSGQGGTLKRSPVLLGYSLPNAWHTVNVNAFANALMLNGLTATEIAWSPNGPPDNKTYPALAQAFVQAMCNRSIITIVELTNANDKFQTGQSDVWFNTRLDEVQTLDPACVLVVPVSEPWADNPTKMKHWTELAKARLGQIIAPANGGTSHPMWPDIQGVYLDAHPCSRTALDGLQALKQPTLLVNTDCGPVLNPGAAFAALWARTAITNMTPLLIYDFKGTVPDYAVISAIGQVVK